MSTMSLWMGRWTQTFKIQVTLHESGEGNINDISFLLFLYSDKITFPSCLGEREIRYLRKVHIFSSFPNFAFSFKAREFKESYKYLNILKMW